MRLAQWSVSGRVACGFSPHRWPLSTDSGVCGFGVGSGAWLMLGARPWTCALRRAFARHSCQTHVGAADVSGTSALVDASILGVASVISSLLPRPLLTSSGAWVRPISAWDVSICGVTSLRNGCGVCMVDTSCGEILMLRDCIEIFPSRPCRPQRCTEVRVFSQELRGAATHVSQCFGVPLRGDQEQQVSKITGGRRKHMAVRG